MIDYSLVNANIAHSRQQLAQRQSTTVDNLYQVDNFFTQELISKLLIYVDSSTQWNSVELQEHLNRASITWDADTVFEETYMVFEQLTDDLNSLFGSEYNLSGLQVWKDSPGYNIKMHVDNNRVGYSAQIYLTGGIDQLGTHFIADSTVEIPYAVNTGYITSVANQIPHGMIKPVPDQHTRYSVYAIWA